MNSCLAFKIFTFEIKGNFEFKKWFNKNSKLAAIITLFGSGNVEMLHLLDSKFANLKIFSAPFSTKALYWIFCGGILNIFVEDLPQLLIQVTYEFFFFFFNFVFLKKKKN